MPKQLFLSFLAFLTAAVLIAATVTGCKEDKEESVTSTAALPTERRISVQEDQAFVYHVYQSYVEIASYIGKGTTVAVPASYASLPVKSIGTDAFSGNRTVQQVTLPDTVINIGNNAFFGCRDLQSVTMPSVKAIGVSAFRDSGLRELQLPPCLENLCQYAFSGTDLTEVHLAGNIAIVGDYAFSDCLNLQKVTIGTGITEISERMFYNCPRLTSFTVPEHITKIGSYAFSSCVGLTELRIPASVTEIEDGILYSSASATVYVAENSAAHRYCIQNSLPYVLS